MIEFQVVLRREKPVAVCERPHAFRGQEAKSQEKGAAPAVFHHEDHLRVPAAKRCLANRMGAACK